jgi:hypothetical protein
MPLTTEIHDSHNWKTGLPVQEGRTLQAYLQKVLVRFPRTSPAVCEVSYWHARTMLLHNGGFCNVCVTKQCITVRCIPKQSPLTVLFFNGRKYKTIKFLNDLVLTHFLTKTILLLDPEHYNKENSEKEGRGKCFFTQYILVMLTHIIDYPQRATFNFKIIL